MDQKVNVKKNEKKKTISSEFDVHLLGGRTMTMDEYAVYLKVLSYKPFLTVEEASTYFNIGVNRIYSLVKDPRADFVVDKENRKRCSRIHRVSFENWIMKYGEDALEEV